MERTFYCEKCKAQSTPEQTENLIKFAADTWLCENCTPKNTTFMMMKSDLIDGLKQHSVSMRVRYINLSTIPISIKKDNEETTEEQ